VAVIKWAPKAYEDLESIVEYIAVDSEEYAKIVARRIIDAVEGIPLFPYSGRIVPEMRRNEIREVIYSSYRIIYRIINQEDVEIVRVIHQARFINNNDILS
jgi:plasmid stabilization system protein ParE